MNATSMKYMLLASAPLLAFFTWSMFTTASTPHQQRSARRERLDKPQEPDDLKGPAPRAVVDEPEYNFGVMRAMVQGSHTFVIRNEGDLPLELFDRGTTCRCTVARIPSQPLGPGEAAEIEVRFNTASKLKHYRQTVRIGTNDPTRRELNLRVSGAVKNRLVVEPTELKFPRIEPGSSATGDVLVFSEVWNDFQIENVRCSLDGATTQLETVELPENSELVFRKGFRIRVTVPGSLPTGSFQGVVQFTLRPNSTHAEPRECEMVVHGTVVGRLAVYGAHVDSDGVVDLGTIRQGTTGKVSLALKVRDEIQDLNLESMHVTPSFVHVRMKRDPQSKAHLHRLEIEVPADAPAASYLGEEAATLVLKFDHPRVRELKLLLRFAVIRDAPFQRQP